MSKKLHPSVEQFRSFVQEHPNLVKSVRNNEYTWQELYEDWYLLGADDPKWDRYKEGNLIKKAEKGEDEKGWAQHLTSILKKMDANQMQHHINNLSQAIGAIQGVLSQFQSNTGQQPAKPPEQRNPFSFRKD